MTSLQKHKEVSCSTHTEEHLKFYCTSHNSIVCCICVIKQHKQCDEILTFPEAIERFEQDGKNLFKAIENQINSIELLIATKNTELIILGISEAESKSEINEICEQLHDVINHKKEELLEYEDELAEEEAENARPDIELLNKMLVSAGNLKHHVDHAFEKRSAFDIIQTMVTVQNMYSDIERTTEDVKKQHTRCIRFQQSDEVHRVLEYFQTLGFITFNDYEDIDKTDGIPVLHVQTVHDVKAMQPIQEGPDVPDDDRFGFEKEIEISPEPRLNCIACGRGVNPRPIETQSLKFNCLFGETEESTKEDIDGSQEHMTSKDDVDINKKDKTTDIPPIASLDDLEIINENTDTVTLETDTGFHTVDHKKPCWLYGIAFITTDQLAITDVAHDSIQVFDVNGTLVCETIVSFDPWDISRVGDGRVAVSAAGKGNINIFQLDGDVLSLVHTIRVGYDCVCLSYSENLFTVGTRSGVVMVTEDGTLVKELARYSNDGEIMRRNNFVTTDTASTHLFLTNIWSNEVVSVNNEGQRWWTLQGQGLYPRGVVWHKNRLFVCSKTPGQVIVVDENGKIVREIGIGKLELPYAIAHHPTGSKVAVTHWDQTIDAAKSRIVNIVTYTGSD